MKRPIVGRANRINSRVVGGSKQTLFRLRPPLVIDGVEHSRVIVASKFGETHVFPTRGEIRVLGHVAEESASAALATVGYSQGGVA